MQYEFMACIPAFAIVSDMVLYIFPYECDINTILNTTVAKKNSLITIKFMVIYHKNVQLFRPRKRLRSFLQCANLIQIM